MRTVLGQPSWRIASDTVEAFVTRTGGHVGPVTFRLGRRRLQPYSVAPWAEEALPAETPAILRALRGDFFCLPFGGNATPFRGEQHPLHGEVANAPWKFESLAAGTLHLSLRTKIRPGRVDKRITLRDGQTVVYLQHVVSGLSGPMTLGHHAMLKFPDEPGCGNLSTSRFTFGQVFPRPTELPENRGYSLLKPGAEFKSLARVPTITGGFADLSRYPARRGFEDIAMIVNDATKPLAWTAVAFPSHGYVWFALKDPRVLRETVFWISNGGRHYPPWNGRHVNVLGMEDVTSYFPTGLAESARPNPLTRRGFVTCLRLNRRRPLAVNYIMAVAAIPRGFDRVASLTAGRGVTLRSASGRSVQVAVDCEFLWRTA